MRILKIVILSLLLFCAFNSISYAQDKDKELSFICVKGVVFDVQAPLAMINDKVLEQGETILGAKVIEITGSSVKFEYEGATIIKEVGDGCLKIVGPSENVIYLGQRKESLKEIVEKIMKLSSATDPKSKVELEKLQKRLSILFQENITLVIAIVLLIAILPYIYYAVTLQMIASKTGTENAWLAWIPIAQVYLECKIAGKPGWWLLLRLLPVLIPFAGLIITSIVTIIVWMGISEARRKSTWLGILSIVPLLNLFLFGYLAFSKDEGPIKKEEKKADDIDLGSATNYRG